jgi:hypothetical protein
MKIKIKSLKTVENWSNRDLLIYFLRKYEEFTTKRFEFPPDAWPGLLARIKGFREKLDLTPQQYKEFIDNIFHIFFTQEEYVPTFGTVVSEKVFYTIKKLLEEKKNSVITNDDFQKLKEELYTSTLFKEVLNNV